MGKRNSSKIFGITLQAALFLLAIACNDIKNKNMEMDYEKVIICGYRSYNQDSILTSGGMHYQINLIAHNQHDYKQVLFFVRTNTYIEKDRGVGDVLKDYPDTIYARLGTIEKYKNEFSKDTLKAFYMPIGGNKIDIDSDAGTLFYYCDECPYEEKLEYGILLESEIFDTVFNDILHVKRCLHYSLYSSDNPFNPYQRIDNTKWHFYYDVDRCMFVQVEIRTLDTNKLIYISKVYSANKIDSSYFNKNYNSAIEIDTIFIPMICY
jgi:predicted nucleic-acid-binding Zn-ribbon protein